MSNKTLLSSDGNRLRLFEDNITVDKTLPKWKVAEKDLPKKKTEYTVKASDSSSDPLGNSNLYFVQSADVVNDDEINGSTSWLHLYKTPEGVNFDNLAKAGIEDLNKLIASEGLKYVLGGYGSYGSSINNSLSIYVDDAIDPRPMNEGEKEEPTWFNRLLRRIMYKKPKSTSEFDALKFFSLVKATSEESVKNYKDRIEGYLHAIHNATSMGQVALVESLAREMISNKYESALYAEGIYHVVTEQQMVDFVKKCEKGLSLCYVKNFARPIPQSVMDTVRAVNDLHIFDNFVVLTYDPNKKAYKETAREEAKRKDPIIFGVIAGSNKLYYVDDWVDEYCDLTLEKFVDTLHISKDDLKMNETII